MRTTICFPSSSLLTSQSDPLLKLLPPWWPGHGTLYPYIIVNQKQPVLRLLFVRRFVTAMIQVINMIYKVAITARRWLRWAQCCTVNAKDFNLHRWEFWYKALNCRAALSVLSSGGDLNHWLISPDPYSLSTARSRRVQSLRPDPILSPLSPPTKRINVYILSFILLGNRFLSQC